MCCKGLHLCMPAGGEVKPSSSANISSADNTNLALHTIQQRHRETLVAMGTAHRRSPCDLDEAWPTCTSLPALHWQRVKRQTAASTAQLNPAPADLHTDEQSGSAILTDLLGSANAGRGSGYRWALSNVPQSCLARIRPPRRFVGRIICFWCRPTTAPDATWISGPYVAIW